MPRPDLSVVLADASNAADLGRILPELRDLLHALGVSHELLIATAAPAAATRQAARDAGATIVEPARSGYGRALAAGLERAAGEFVLTVDPDAADLAPIIRTLWHARTRADIIVASRYLEGGSARMPLVRRMLSRALNLLFRRGVSLPLHDLSSSIRLYRTAAIRPQLHTLAADDYDALPEILVRAFADGRTIAEVPFAYVPRRPAMALARAFRCGLAYLRTLWSLWKLRNSILAADYDDRAHDSPIALQRYWQRSRHRHVIDLIANEGPVLDVGCGSSRIIAALPPGSVGVDVLARKLRYARKFGVPLVHGSGFNLPFPDRSFSCVLCSQVIEHVPKESPILDELCRVLAPGGRLVLGTPDYANWQWVWIEKAYAIAAPGGYADEHIAHYTYDELIETFKARGFRVEDHRYILRGELILAFRKLATVPASAPGSAELQREALDGDLVQAADLADARLGVRGDGDGADDDLVGTHVGQDAIKIR